MLDFLAPRLHLGCSTTGLALLRRDRFGRHAGVPIERSLLDAPGSAALLAQQLRAALAEAHCAGATVSMTLADDWFRLFVVTPPSNAAQQRDLDAAVAMRFGQLYGNDATDWVLQPGWQAGAPFLVAAMPRTLQAALHDIGTELRLRWVAILPHCVAAWNRWHGALKNGDWFGVAHDGMLSLLILDGANMIALRRQSIDQADMKNPAWLTEYVQREALRLNLPAPQRVQLCGEVPQPWTGIAPQRIACLALVDNKLPARSPDAALAQAGVPA
ncbi:hypothetical protein [Actimicrobium antarcticum]|uniref:Uncharacterized protein n=1 Tax=Actimicrobium antarcticum TaxID=1051899 RepID=A0ABP7TTC9_9BURK